MTTCTPGTALFLQSSESDIRMIVSSRLIRHRGQYNGQGGRRRFDVNHNDLSVVQTAGRWKRVCSLAYF